MRRRLVAGSGLWHPSKSSPASHDQATDLHRTARRPRTAYILDEETWKRALAKAGLTPERKPVESTAPAIEGFSVRPARGRERAAVRGP